MIASSSAQLIARPMIDHGIRKMIRGGRSRIVDLMLRSPDTAYPVSERAVQIYAQTVAPTCGAARIRIVALSPGIIDTDMGKLEHAARPQMSRMLALTPIARAGTANEIASVVSFLASPAASYIHGTDILVDGGTIAGIAAAGGPARALR